MIIWRVGEFWVDTFQVWENLLDKLDWRAGELFSLMRWRFGEGGSRRCAGKEERENKESRSLCVIALLWREQNIAAEVVRWSLPTYIVFVWRK